MGEPRQAKIVRVWDETPSLKGIVLEVEPEVVTSYTNPGQVVVVHAGGEKVYLAIASSPGEEAALELLLGPAACKKIEPQEGQSLQIEPPFGNGFPLELALGKDVLLFCVGSALAPVRPVVEHLRRARSDYGCITLYVGAHTESDFPYQQMFDDWKRDRIDIVRSISKPWVQDQFRRDPVDVRNAVAFVVGMKEMVADVKSALVEQGLSEELIKSNW